MSDPLTTYYRCGNTLFGMRDDVPESCWGCKRLTEMRRSEWTFGYCGIREPKREATR